MEERVKEKESLGWCNEGREGARDRERLCGKKLSTANDFQK